MTNTEKIIAGKLLDGHRINGSSPGCIRLVDLTGHPIMKIPDAFFYEIRPVLRKKKLLFLIDLRKVRSMHGNSFIKKLYKGTVTAPDGKIPPPRYPKGGEGPRQLLQRSFNLLTIQHDITITST